jgi:poly(A)-specific ribonuclease
LFTNGLSFVNEATETKVREEVEQKQQTRAEQLKQRISEEEIDTSNRNYLPVPENEIEMINEAREKIQKVIDNKMVEAKFEKLSAFQRKLVYELLEREFNNKLSTATKTGDNNRKFMVVTTKRTVEEELKIDADRKREDDTYLVDTIGLRLLLKEISQSKKLIVGHNCLMDLMYVTSQCFTSLPHSYEEFKKLIHQIFPNIIDTKFIASSEKFKEIFKTTVLNHVYDRIQSAPFENVEFEWENIFQTYHLDNPKEHEAGFDSFLTGYIFLVISKYLKVKFESKFEKGKELAPFLNRIALQRISTPYIYLTGQEPHPCRSHVFHIKFPSTWLTADIQDQFKNYGPIQISWVDSTTAFVSLYNRENSSCVIKTIAKPNGFQIESFDEFHRKQNQTQAHKRKKEDSDTEPLTPETKSHKRKKTFAEGNNW